MAGEQSESDVTREEFPVHFAIADKIGGTVRPFDVYQGPYIYTDAAGGPAQRLFLSSETDGFTWYIWNEQTTNRSRHWPSGHPEEEEIAAGYVGDVWPPSKKVIPVCSTCGSDDVRCDAYGAWDAKEQRWELSASFEKGSVCEDCGGECSVLWINAPPESPWTGVYERDGSGTWYRKCNECGHEIEANASGPPERCPECDGAEKEPHA